MIAKKIVNEKEAKINVLSGIITKADCRNQGCAVRQEVLREKLNDLLDVE